MATMIIGNIRSVSSVLSTIGKTNAAKIRSAGSQYFLTKALLLPSALHRRAVAEEAARPEDEHQDQHGEDHDRGPPDADVLVCHGPDDAYKEPPDHSPCQVADAAKD